MRFLTWKYCHLFRKEQEWLSFVFHHFSFMRCWLVWVERKWGSAPSCFMREVIAGSGSGGGKEQTKRSTPASQSSIPMFQLNIKARRLTLSNVHACEYFDEEPNCVLHDADWFPGRRRAGRVIMCRLWLVLKDMVVSPICIGGSSNTNSDSWSNPQARSLLTRTWCPDIYFVLGDHVADVYTSSVIAEDWLFWWCEEGGGGVVVHFSSALHQFVVSHFCPQPHPSHTVTLTNLPLYITVCLQFLLCIFFCMGVFVPLCVSSLNICVFSCVCVYSDLTSTVRHLCLRPGRVRYKCSILPILL